MGNKPTSTTNTDLKDLEHELRDRETEIALLSETVNVVNKNDLARGVLQSTLGVHKDRELPPYAPRKFRSSYKKSPSFAVKDGKETPG
jgi:hypothetical protein